MDLTPEEVQEIHDKFPHRIPVVVAKAELSIAPEIQGNKYLVPANITSRNLQILISRRIEALPTGMRLVLTVAGASLLDGCNKKIGDLVKSHGNSQGILHVMYDVEEGEFSSSHGVDESVQIQGDACYSEDHWVTSRSSSPVKMPAQAQTLKDNSPSLTD
jgi:GABA(A) receptor-associated protein